MAKNVLLPVTKDSTFSTSTKRATFSSVAETLNSSEADLLRQDVKACQERVRELMKVDAATVRQDAKRIDAEVQAILAADPSRAVRNEDR